MEARMTPERARLAAGLDAAEANWLSTPIVWGESDCLMSIADVLRDHCFGFDTAKQFRGRYTTPRGYRRILKRAGFDTLDAAIADAAAALGLREIKPADGQVGDLGIIPHEVGRSCVLCKGNGFWIGRRGDFALSVRPVAAVERAWAVL